MSVVHSPVGIDRDRTVSGCTGDSNRSQIKRAVDIAVVSGQVQCRGTAFVHGEGIVIRHRRIVDRGYDQVDDSGQRAAGIFVTVINRYADHGIEIIVGVRVEHQVCQCQIYVRHRVGDRPYPGARGVIRTIVGAQAACCNIGQRQCCGDGVTAIDIADIDVCNRHHCITLDVIRDTVEVGCSRRTVTSIRYGNIDIINGKDSIRTENTES